MIIKRRKLLMAGVAGVLAMTGSLANAAPTEIIATPQETKGGFIHNVFHSASSHGGMGGSIKAWTDLDTSETSTWDPITGDLSIYLNVFTSSSLGTQIGVAHGVTSGAPLAAAGFTGTNTNALVGQIDWSISLDAGTSFGAFLSAEGLDLGGDEFAYTQSFLDHEYATSQSGYVANSWDVDKSAVTLWGADGDYKSNGLFDLGTGNTHVGTDLVFEVVPAPGAGMLGLLGLGMISMVRKRNLGV